MSRERNKGNAAEREVVAIAKDQGFDDARRSGDAGQWDSEEDDILGVPGLRLSVKRQERLRLDDWSHEVEARVQGDEIPAVAYRRNREPWRISLSLEEFLKLYGAFFE